MNQIRRSTDTQPVESTTTFIQEECLKPGERARVSVECQDNKPRRITLVADYKTQGHRPYNFHPMDLPSVVAVLTEALAYVEEMKAQK